MQAYSGPIVTNYNYNIIISNYKQRDQEYSILYHEIVNTSQLLSDDVSR